MLRTRKVWRVAYDNSLSAWNPTLWAQESLAILEENMVIANLVHRDFENVIAEYGEVVTTRQPGTFTAKRKGPNDNVTVQNAEATPVNVTLNQQLHVSFLIRDAERAKSFADLVSTYLRPALLAEAQGVDRTLLGQIPRFLTNKVGKLGKFTSSTAQEYILDARQKMNDNKAYVDGRNMIVTSPVETNMLKTDLFVSAERVGDQGTALRNASVGRKLGWDFFMCQNAPYVTGTTDVVTGAINLTGGYAAGTTSVTVDGFSAAITNGTWITIEGDNRPLKVTSTTGGATPTVIGFTDHPLAAAVLNDAVVTVYDPGAVNKSAGYAIGYDGEITVNNFTLAPQVGQGVTFGTGADTNVYTIIEVNGVVGITLDRALVTALTNTETVNLMPSGSYNFGFHRNALTLVTRPLPRPMANLALSSVVNFNGLSIRVVITYDGNKQGHLVTVDMLLGTEVLDTDLGVVMLG